jgi:hypothetical protein
MDGNSLGLRDIPELVSRKHANTSRGREDLAHHTGSITLLPEGSAIRYEVWVVFWACFVHLKFALLISQRHHRVDSRSPPRGKKARKQRDDG